VVRRVGPITTIGSTAEGTAAVTCVPGERAVGGGGVAWTGEGRDFVLISSRPTIPGGNVTNVETPTGWLAEYCNADTNQGDSIDVRAYVVCASP
jgi:hypothetical protein